MRKIQFRGKREDNGEWVYGCYLETQMSGVYIIGSTMEAKGKKESIKMHDKLWQAEVIPETVGQYTGLKDKNDNEIYEGDIVENTTQTVYLGDKYEVVWNKNYAGYQLMSNGFTSNIPLIQNFMSYEVIGNIYENPELLKDDQTGGTERKEREM